MRAPGYPFDVAEANKAAAAVRDAANALNDAIRKAEALGIEVTLGESSSEPVRVESITYVQSL